MTVISAAIDAIFADPNVAYAATYKHGAAAAVPVRILLKSPDVTFAPFVTGGQAPERLVEIRVSEAPNLAEGDLLTFALGAFPPAAFPVVNFKLDRNGYVWSVKVG